jgi:hypothetical protein
MERFFYNFQPASLPPDGVDQYGFPDYEDDGLYARAKAIVCAILVSNPNEVHTIH